MKAAIGLALLASCLFISPLANSQGLLKRVKEKVNQAVDKIGSTEAAKKTGTQDSPSGNNGNNISGKPTNKGGGGLTNTEPPDVKLQMDDAEKSFASKSYSDARYSIQQALMGIEIQLGRQILKSLPMTSVALPADTLQDKVMSTQWGWSNLSIQRVYRDGDKQETITIGNNAMYSAALNMYLANGGMVQANGDSQNMKQVRVKNNKAIIQYDDSKGYTLIVPLGQTSMIIWECINFASEQEVMTAANAFDIDGIKKMLGEQ